MKRILIILAFVASFFGASAQKSWTPINGYQRFVSGLGIPVRDSSYYNLPTDTAFIFINYHDSLPYYKYKSWIRPLGGSGGGTITLSGAVTGSGTSSIVTTLSNGVVGIANHSATGTPSSTTYLRGDNTWATITGGGMVYPASGIALSTGSAWGTSITDNSANWNTAYTNRITSLTTTGTSGAATLSANVLNIPNYTYTLPTATSTVLGGVKPDGTSILNTAGVISVTLASIGAQAAGSYQPLSTNLTSIGGLANAAGVLRNNGTGTFSYDNTVLTANQAITVTATGDATGTSTSSGTAPSLPLTLATVTQSTGANFVKITLDTKGRVTGNTAVALADINTAIGSQAANTFHAAPNGSAGTPTFRAIVAADIPTLNQNTTGSAASFTGSLVGDVTGTQGATVVGKINGVALSGLATGILKNTTTTGVPSIAVAGTDYQAPISLTTTGASGAATFVSNTLNVPTYTLAGLGGISAVTGTTNRITVTGGTAIDIASTYVGQATITTLGTIATGTWNAGAVTSSGAVTGTSIVKSGGTASQILAADGSVITAGSGITISAGTIQASGTAGVTTFSAGTTGLTPNTATSGAVTLAGTLAIANGGTNLTTLPVTPAASTYAAWDANKNLAANNGINAYTTTATTAGVTTLTVASSYQQYFTGTTTQTVTLPVVTTLVNGYQLDIVNNSTGVVTVQTSGAVTVQALAANTELVITCINTAGGTGTASWGWRYFPVQATAPGVTTISMGTTGLTPSAATSGAVTVAGTLAATNGGTGQTVYAIGDLLSANTTTSLSKIADVAAGQPLLSGGVSTLPAYAGYTFSGTAAQTYTFPTTSKTLAANDGSNWTFASQAIGDLHYATSATAYGRLADVAAGSPLLSGGVATAPAYATYLFSGTAAATYTFPTASKTLAANDGSNLTIASQAIGDILTATSTTAYGRLADVAVGSYLRSGGVGTAPLWSTLILPNAATVGDLMLATSTNTIASLADAATGNALISGGAGVVPSYGKIGLTTHVSGTLPIANGGTNVTAVTTAPTATAFAGWDANKNLSANNLIDGYTTTATAAGTTTLTVASTYQQFFTGTTTQTVVLPVATTLVNGQQFSITNNSTGVVTVQTSGAVTVVAMAANTQLNLTCINTAGGTGTASWGWSYSTQNNTTISGGGTTTNALTMNNGGAGAASGTTFNGSAAQTISYNTIGASPLAGSASLTTVGTIGTGTWNATAIANTVGGTGLNTSASTGVPSIASGTWSVNATLPISLGGTGSATQNFVDLSTNQSVSGVKTMNSQLIAGSGVNATTTATGALKVIGGVGISNDVWIGGIINSGAITSSGAVQVGGWLSQVNAGLPLAWNTNVGGTYLQTGFSGAINVETSNGRMAFYTAPSGTAAAAVTLTERLTIGNTGVITIPSSTASTSGTTGALVVTGGVGVSGVTYLSGGAFIAGLTVTGNAVVNGTIQLQNYTVATLPAASSSVGVIAFVTDATSPTYNTTVNGGGAVKTLVLSNGTNWVCH